VHHSLRLGSSLALTALLVSGFSACGVFVPSSPPAPAGSTPGPARPIRLNTVGYLPESAKLATVIAPGGALFNVRNAVDDSIAWNNALAAGPNDELTGEPLFIADFREFCGLGDYYLEVPDLGRSATFTVGPNVYMGVLTQSMIGMYGQRCGTAVHIELDGETWGHGACHQKDGSLKYLTGVDQHQASTGGWHDAGDYGKYTTNGAFSAGMMLAAWEQFQGTLANLSLPIPEHGGAIPDFLAEVKWELDWLLTMPAPDGSGGIPHKLTALNFEALYTTADSDLSARYLTPVGTAATADFVAVMAAAARLYRPYDAAYADACLAAARLSYGFLQANAGPAVPDITMTFKTGSYGDGSDADERIWAAAEMWETTGEPELLADFETRAARAVVASSFDWANVQNLGLFRYLLSARDGRNPDLVARLQASLVSSADALVAAAAASGYGRPVAYWWGANGSVARTAMNLATANALSPKPAYVDAIVSALDHLLGRNHYDRSQVTMVGSKAPLHPHHRPSISDSISDPWPGLLVGGQDCPGTDSNCSTDPKYNWTDDQSLPNVNEIAVNWNGALVYAAASVAR
jgi:endoglucanase